ncbi:UNVERIFIED_CONTAM: bifunctional adenosylcobinamide kinase/adenosylcobinamide-phosphate guanylyltransferase [Halobacillus marinus]|uniref:bifunctional adenosylcobinamide kinase/adenosylcobinamide-phosphate guanylyltransferase n=1 Tax=unclassified Halobacillus TaxID=2636472 RepID=UPI0002A4EC8E|nr:MULTISPECIES: bifunctional adenosylcobinamide kinase/adenosylcobinamide-phosphate guanylyltransferase [unclassified Halobacillus]ELK48045.1 bifunctional adenosylcobinamide kinase/cobinamide phosphate guanyltransferase [Halobacillus sp. BAB-2008]
MEGTVTFVSGGARSGKSAFAESRAKVKSSTGKLIYVATAEVVDEEMEDRIIRHRKDRGIEWRTMEAPVHIAGDLMNVEEGSAVLIDCVTIWVSHLMYDEKEDLGMILEKVKELLRIGREKRLQLIFVSNDVNEGTPVQEPSVMEYIRTLQDVHQLLAAKADEAFQVISGIPLSWKEGIG